jgi:hypothetical protein
MLTNERLRALVRAAMRWRSSLPSTPGRANTPSVYRRDGTPCAGDRRPVTRRRPLVAGAPARGRCCGSSGGNPVRLAWEGPVRQDTRARSVSPGAEPCACRRIRRSSARRSPTGPREPEGCSRCWRPRRPGRSSAPVWSRAPTPVGTPSSRRLLSRLTPASPRRWCPRCTPSMPMARPSSPILTPAPPPGRPTLPQHLHLVPAGAGGGHRQRHRLL